MPRNSLHATGNSANTEAHHCPKYTNAIIDGNRNSKNTKIRCLGDFQWTSLTTRTAEFFKRFHWKWCWTHFTCWNTACLAIRKSYIYIYINLYTRQWNLVRPDLLTNRSQTQRDRICELSHLTSCILAKNAPSTGNGRFSNYTLQAASISASIPTWCF